MASKLVALPAGKSKVWQHFGFKVDSQEKIINKKEVICRKCEKLLPYSGNTTNLTHHLKQYHEEEYSLLLKTAKSSPCKSSKKEQPKIEYFTKSLYPRSSQRFKSCKDALVEYLCKDMEPLSAVDSLPFLKLIQTLDPRYKPSSRSHFTRVLLPVKYESIKAVVKDSLKNAGWCSLTTDMWTGYHSRSYIAVTAHTISAEWEMKSYCLATREVTDGHTAETISLELSDVIAEWELDDKVFGMTTDNAKNVKNAVDNLGYTHFGRIGHILQLSISRGLQLGFVARVLGHVRKLVEHFHKSTNAMYSL